MTTINFIFKIVLGMIVMGILLIPLILQEIYFKLKKRMKYYWAAISPNTYPKIQ